jgi:hypothetical protein
VPKPDCQNRIRYRIEDFPDTEMTKTDQSDLIIVPNPVIDDKFTIFSQFKETEFEILNAKGIKIKSGNFKGSEFKMNLELSSGLYIVKYFDNISKKGYFKLIKI